MDLPKIRHMGVILEPHVAEMRFEPLPEMGPKDLLLKMETCNICTTDYQHWDGLRNHQGFPMAGGHEWSGVVLAKGEDANLFEIGDRVGVIHGGCGECDNCKRGRSFACTARRGRREPINGYLGARGFSDYNVVNQRSVVKVSKDIPAAEAGFLEPAATVICGMRRLRVQPGETVAVIGAGTMGLLNAQVARAFGARVIISELLPKKLERARSMGIADVIDAKNSDPVEAVKELTEGKGVDAVIAAVGLGVAYRQGYEMLKRVEGRFLLFAAGYPAPKWEINPNEIHYRRIEIIGTMSGDEGDFIDAGFLISHKLISPKYSLEKEVFPLRDIQQAFQAAATPGAYRVTVDLQGV